jgi:uncharacterized protein YhjY with autotransporter beta-barrel domain
VNRPGNFFPFFTYNLLTTSGDIEMRYWPLVGLACLSGTAWAQDPTTALANQWNTICSTASGGALAARCGETFASSSSQANLIAAEGQNMDELPGQGRASTAQSDQERYAEESIELGKGFAFSLNAQIGRTKRKADLSEAAFRGSSEALQAGLDWTPNKHITAGISLGRAREDLDFAGTDSFTESDGNQFALYLNWRVKDNVSIDAYAGRANADSSSQREIQYQLPNGASFIPVSGLSIADSSSSQASYGLSANIAFKPRGAWEQNLGVSIDQTKTTLDAFREVSSSGLALSVPKREINSRQASISYSAAYTRSYEWGVWQPTAGVSLRRELSNPVRRLTVNLVEDVANNPISFTTAAPDKNWVGVNIGSNFVFTKGHSVYVQYSRRIGHSFLQDEVLALGWRVEL